jgi:hypothetical protein
MKTGGQHRTSGLQRRGRRGAFTFGGHRDLSLYRKAKLTRESEHFLTAIPSSLSKSLGGAGAEPPRIGARSAAILKTPRLSAL